MYPKKKKKSPIFYCVFKKIVLFFLVLSLQTLNENYGLNFHLKF